MEQAVETAAGLLLILLISLAVVSAVAIVVLLELGWILRLAARLYWRWHSSVHLSEVDAEQPGRAGQNQDTPIHQPHPPAHSNGTLSPPASGGAVYDRGEGDPHWDKGE